MKKIKIFLGLSIWSKWENLSAGTLSNKPYLLQARQNQFGKIQFKVRSTSTGAYYCAFSLEILTQKLT